MLLVCEERGGRELAEPSACAWASAGVCCAAGSSAGEVSGGPEGVVRGGCSVEMVRSRREWEIPPCEAIFSAAWVSDMALDVYGQNCSQADIFFSMRG